jgi:hypothetical protein
VFSTAMTKPQPQFLLPLALALLAISMDNQLAAAFDAPPDAWTRANDGDTSHFGWDDFSNPSAPFLPTVPFPTGARVLDDTTPDIDPATTATGIRLYQGADGIADYSPTTYGHVSSSGNYYSGFNDSDFADDTLTAIAPASGTGGYTTAILQIAGSGVANPDLAISISGADWVLDKSSYGLEGPTGVYWIQWYAPGNDLPLAIDIDSEYSSVAIDAIQVDTHWSATAPVLNVGPTLTVPEPASGLLAAGAAVVALIYRQRA